MKKNPQDLTLRNLRALKRRVDKLDLDMAESLKIIFEEVFNLKEQQKKTWKCLQGYLLGRKSKNG
jgi:hypothetical protein